MRVLEEAMGVLVKTMRMATEAVSFSDDEFVIGPCRSTATHDNDKKMRKDKRVQGPSASVAERRIQSPRLIHRMQGSQPFSRKGR